MTLDAIELGDCYELIKGIPDKSVDLIYTDIPYLYKHIGAGNSEIGQRMSDKKKYLNGITDGIDYRILEEFVRVSKYIYAYIWCSKDQILDIANYLTGIPGRKVSFNILVWCKNNPMPVCNGTLLSDVEYCLLFKEEGSPRFNDGYRLKSKFHISGVNQSDKDSYGHPTIKPLELVERHIEHSTQPGDVILDPFMGSGTTAVACKNLGRHFVGFEISPEYHKIATDRLQGITKKESESGYIQDSLF